MRSFLFGLLLLPLSGLFAQDTIKVHTFTFDSISTRRGWFQFPDSTHHFRKVLMHHTLKCSPLTPWDQYDCGEWDYLTYHFVHEHTGALDSTALTHPYFLVGIAAPPSIVQNPALQYDTVRTSRPHTSVTPINMTDHPLGNGGSSETATFPGAHGVSRSQYLFTASELVDAGVLPGVDIPRLRLNVLSDAGHVDRCRIRVKNMPASSLTSFDEVGLSVVFDGPLDLVTGENTIDLTSPILWSGAPFNLLVEVAIERDEQLASPVLLATATGFDAAVHTSDRDGFLELNDDFIGVPASVLSTVNDQVTISLAVYGDASLPLNNSVLEGSNANGQRVLNIHLPWSDSNVYWDAGNDGGGGYDRINKAATPPQIKGGWNHWAFVKNTTTGSMKIYLNGVLWHSGTGKTLPMGGITTFKIGAASNGSIPYPGMIDEVNIFNTEVSATDIANWSGRRIDASHPDYANLVASYHFDEEPSSTPLQNTVDASTPAYPMGTVRRRYRSIEETGTTTVGLSTIRPDIVLVQGDHSIAVDTVAVDRKIARTMESAEFFEVQGNYAVPYDTIIGWQGPYAYTYNGQGSAIDSTYIGGNTIVNDTLHYFGVPFEVINDHEIGRYITPYGIGLDLGPNGFRWTYDVTDYQWLLRDSVDLSAGNTQELLDLSFDMIEGDAPREVVDMKYPWGPQRSYSYGSLSDDSQLSAVTVPLSPDAHQWMLLSRFTGHGDATSIPNVQGCCEFKDNTHSIVANGNTIDDWHVWQTDDCALNPVYPQGGTWIYAREGWCPGDVVKDHATELTQYVSGNSITLDYGITPVPQNNPGMAGGNYVVNMNLFEYGSPTHARDAEIYNVKRPSDVGLYARENPICYDPLITLRNAGAEDLTSVLFSYRISGGPTAYYTWTGTLKHMAVTDVQLPVPWGDFWAGDAEHVFTIDVVNVNGSGDDDYDDNDHYRTHFELPVIYPQNFVLFFKTNNNPEEDHITIKDIHGNVVFSHDNLAANTIYKDTLDLQPGCYALEVLDDGYNGLSFWAEPGQGTGYFRFRSLTNQTLRTFDPDFGRSIRTAFSIDNMVGITEHPVQLELSASPVPTDGPVDLYCRGVQGEAHLQVIDPLGRTVLSSSVMMTDARPYRLDLSDRPSGVYLVVINSEERQATLRFVKQ